MTPSRRTLTALGALLALAALVRGGVLWKLGENLADDRDTYLAIARQVADGEGYTRPADGLAKPTAYRPPLYPLLLAGILRAGGGTFAVGAVHLLLSLLTVLLTWLCGRRLGLPWGAYFAAGLVALDPLLSYYLSLPMTETLCTFLVTLLMFLLIPVPNDTASEALRGGARFESAAAGLVFGLGVLCRPTLWAFGLCMTGAWLVRIRKTGLHGRLSARVPWTALAVLVLTVSPWVIRNAVVFGRPIVTTTHGGYTLLLGNNPVFYRDVVQQPWGTVWQGDSLRAWQRALDKEMAAGDITGEPARDRWMYHRAWEHILENPGLFVRACLLRIGRFWNVSPLGPVAETLPVFVLWGIRLFYGAILLGALVSLFRLSREEWSRWLSVVLLLLSFTAVHAVYWSNMRMRAPLVPAVALLASRSLMRRTSQPASSGDDVSSPVDAG